MLRRNLSVTPINFKTEKKKGGSVVATPDDQKLFVMSHTPTISIGLPVFNGARYLREAIEDFLRQTYTDFELIVSDNASTDETEAIVREASKRDERIRYVRNNTNIGALPNSNRVFELAQGRYFCLAAHDDRHAPNFLERLVAVLEENPDAVLAYGRTTLIGEEGEALRKDPATGKYVSSDGQLVWCGQDLERPMPVETVSRYRAVLRSSDVNAPIHGLYRRDILAEIGGHQIHGSDRLIVSYAALLGRFVFVDAALFAFRIHADSTLFLDRDAWAERETARADPLSPVSTLITFMNYVRVVRRSPLSAAERMRAYMATLGYAVRPTALRNTFLPGLDNYFGWQRWPWQRKAKTQFTAPSASANSTKGIHA